MKTHLNLSHTTLTVIKGKYELLSCFPWGSCLLNKRGGYWNIQFLRAKNVFPFSTVKLEKVVAFKKQKGLEQLIRQWAAKQEGFVKTFPFLRSVRELSIEHSNPLRERRDLHFKRKGFPWIDILFQFHRLTPGHNNNHFKENILSTSF